MTVPPATLAASDFEPGRMPVPLLVAFGVALACWLLLLAVLATATRPHPVTAGPATLERGPEPPAVVNLLAGGWRMTTDAVSATLLDLAARDLIEFDQLGPEPERTVCRVRGPDPTGLTRYEQRVYDRVAGLAVGGVVPAAALPRGSKAQAAAWWRRFRREVVREAQRLGLSRNRWGRPAQLALQVGALLPAVGAAAAVAPADSDRGAVLGVAVAVWFGLTALTQRLNRQRDTAPGRAAAARWLGLRDHLGRDEAFGTLPPAAVAIWDRYLGYGAAMGVAGTASRVLAFGAQDERLAWSAYGGTWHRVRIRYPGTRLVEGRHPAVAGLLGCLAVVAGYYGVRLFAAVRGSLDGGSQSGRWVLFGLTLVAAGLAVWGGCTVGRAVLGLAHRRAVEGEVLRVRAVTSDDRTTGYEIAIDDGTQARIRAWPVSPSRMPAVSQGDVVRAIVGAGLRHVYRVTVLQPGRAPTEDAGEAEPAPVLRTSLTLVGSGPGAGSDVDPASLLTAAEVSEAFGRPFGPPRSLTEEHTLPFLGMRMCEFPAAGEDGGPARVQVQTVTGRIARAMLERVRGEPLSGIGEEAYLRGDTVAILHGDVGIAIHAQHVEGASTRPALCQLAAIAAGRLPAPRSLA